MSGKMKYGYDVLASVLEHMAVAYSADGRVNVRFQADMIRQAFRKGAIQLRRRHRQKARHQEAKALARVLGAQLVEMVSAERGAQ